MQHQHRRPGIDRARDHVLKAVRARGLRPGDKLSPVRYLASRAGVAFAGMWRALRQCAEEGLLSTRPGSPYRVKTLDRNMPPEDHSVNPEILASLPTA